VVVSQRKLNNESVVNNDDAFDDESAVAVGNDQDVFVRDRFFEKKRRRREKIFA